MGRPAQARLSPEAIADAAVALIDSGQPFGLNAVARRLGVKPPSLYNHVDGIGGIIELVRGRLAAQYLTGIDEADEEIGWDEVVEAMLRAERRMYTEHPHVLPLIATSTVRDEGVIHAYDLKATQLVRAGFPESEVLVVVQLLDAFALGSGLDYAAPDAVWEPSGPTVTLGRLLDAGPRGRERNDQAFEIGLGMLMAGLRERLAVHLTDA
ncbi:TetR/AcrR family transcriptional regulator [Zhihengliuella halotolerans]|uniref:TetR/AcrR family transcriptional regulator n=1 Tax=Zhihengliuella halotolerans TaxID=370736 RepID=UPI0011AEEA9C|nr:TetR/AcrR family transcriptional regulator C-terminal domain-containing protein [Zhihengliuella halotolerans]